MVPGCSCAAMPAASPDPVEPVHIRFVHGSLMARDYS